MKKIIMPTPKQLQPWMKHVRSVEKKHPKMVWKSVLKLASKSYKPKTTTKKTVTKKKSKTYPNGRPYLTGAAWHMDRHMFNKNQPWELPRSQRKVSLYN